MANSQSTFANATQEQEAIDHALATMNTIPKSASYGSVKICTMTVSLVLKTSVNLEKMREAMVETKVTDFITEVLGTELILKHQNQTSTSFNNCLIFTFTEDSQKTIKVFSNGGLHITGAKTITEAITFGQFFETLLAIIFFDDPGAIENVQLINFSVNMINMTFQYTYHVDLFCLAQLLSTMDVKATYDQDRHPGVICKLLSKSTTRNITVIFFRTGAIIMTGIKEAKEALEAHAFVVRFMHEHKDKLLVLEEEKRRKRKKGENSYDYGSFLILK